jgi:hypothetical protein
MGQQKERLLRLIDFLEPEAEARARYEQGVAEADDDEAGKIADIIEAILNATPEGQEAIKRYVAKELASLDKKPRS